MSEPMSACVVIIRDGKIAGIRSKKRNGSICLPGGKSEPGERPEDTAARECREEIGVTPKIESLLYRRWLVDYDVWVFLASLPEGAELVSSEEGEAGWFTPEELLTGHYAAHTREWLPLVEELRVGRLRDLLARLHAPDARLGFTSLFAETWTALRLDERSAAERFGTSIPIVSRWRSGKTVPPGAAIVIGLMRQYVRQELARVTQASAV